jgi:hypothetical protein
MKRLVAAGIVVASGATVSCTQDSFGPVLDVPISPAAGHFVSPPFSIHESYGYAIGIGVEARPVDHATCLAALSAERRTSNPPCRALTPQVGAFTWVVTHHGNVVARGAQPATPTDLVRDTQGSSALEKISWGFYDRFHAEPGDGYVVELSVEPSDLPLEQFHPRLAVMKTFK